MDSDERVPDNPSSVYPAVSGGNPGGTPGGGGVGNCPQCGSTQQVPHPAFRGWVYAIGRITPQFPDLGVEKEFAQLGGAGAAGGLPETNRLIDVLKEQGAGYLARQLCWIFHNGQAETFMLECRSDVEAERLVDAMPRAEEAEQTIQVVIGSISYHSPADAPCAGMALPSVVMDHHLTFPMAAFIDSLAVAEQGGGEKDAKSKGKAEDEAFRSAARDLFARLTRRSDNRGMTDEHRALNYVALRYPPMYRLAADAQHSEKSLVDVQVRRGPGGTRRLVAVRMVFRARRTDVLERYQCLVDVTDRFPFLAAPLTPVYD